MNKGKAKRKVLTYTLVSLLTLGATFSSIYAHGYIDKSRAELARDGVNVNAGPVRYEPQSVEGPGNFPEAGPADGKIAGGGKFSALDEQSSDRWFKVPMKGGKNTLTWTLTAPHRTSEFKYYITKKGWDPNQPLKRSDLEEIARIEGNGQVPPSTVSHTIDVPKDRSGYHIILGVWEIADTTNAFYQVIDVELDNGSTTDPTTPDEDTTAPTSPTNLIVKDKASSKISLSWSASKDNVGVDHYDIYRDNKKINTVKGTSFVDSGLTPDTEYRYYVKALDNSGNESKNSQELVVKTDKAPQNDTEAPTAPSNLHSMGETVSSIDLHWTISEDNVGIKHYNIYRNNILIKSTSKNRFMDNNLMPNTKYNYRVQAIDLSDNGSEFSNTLSIKTKAEDTTTPTPDKPTTWIKGKVYTKGDTVVYNGVEYTAKWWTRGDTPAFSEAWQPAADAKIMWDSRATYLGGSRVHYKGAIYEAKWWTRGDNPETSMVWTKI